MLFSSATLFLDETRYQLSKHLTCCLKINKQKKNLPRIMRIGEFDFKCLKACLIHVHVESHS